MAGFGGVAEYGITVRWDKNFLKVIRLLLERRDHFALYGGVRFGGTIDVDGAFALGFDHVALAAGAGKPTVLELPNGLANGVRTASDFLMALQLTGAAKTDSLANMQLRLPVIVSGRARGITVSEQHNDGDGVWHEYARLTLSARTILIAAGTQPNTVLAREDPVHFELDGKYFRLLDEGGNAVKPLRGLAKPDQPAVLTEIRGDGRAVSFFGDLHPSFYGNVVKAMASAKQGYPIVSRMLARAETMHSESTAAFIARLD